MRIKIDPQLGNGYYERARMFARKNDHQRAIADYSAALKLAPRDVNALGVAYQIGGQALAPGLQLWVPMIVMGVV